MDLQPRSWGNGAGSLDSDLDRILAGAAEGSLPDSLPGGAGSLESMRGSFGAGSLGVGGLGSRETSLEHVSSFGSNGSAPLYGMSAGFRVSQSSLPSPGIGGLRVSQSLPSPGGAEFWAPNLFPAEPGEQRREPAAAFGLSPAEPLVRQKSVPANASMPSLVKVANTSCTLSWEGVPGGEGAGLWYHLYRIDEGMAEGDETSTLVYSTQDLGFLKFTCGGLVEGTEYHFGLVVESVDRMTQSALSDLLAVTVGLTCQFAHLHSKGAGVKGKVNVQEKPFSRVAWVKMRKPPPPICERCTSTLRKCFKNQTTSKQLCVEFLVHVEKARCKTCQEWCTHEECNSTGDFLCQLHSGPVAKPVPPAAAAAAAAALPALTTGAPPAQWVQPQPSDDLGGLNGLMQRSSIAEEEEAIDGSTPDFSQESPTHGPTLATETDHQMSERLVRHKIEQLVTQLKAENFGQLLAAQYSDRSEADHLGAENYEEQATKRKMVGKSFESVVTTQLGDLMIVVFDNMRERVGALPSYILPKWHAMYNTESFDQLWELEHARSELVQEVLSREDFGRNLYQAVKRSADLGELPESHADMLNRPGFYDSWCGVLAQSGCVMVVYTCPRGSAVAASRVIAALPAVFSAAGVSAVAPIVGGNLREVMHTGLVAQDHDCVFGGEVVPLEGAVSLLERMVEEGYEQSACEWIAAKPEAVTAWLNVEGMSLLHKAVLGGAREVVAALLAAAELTQPLLPGPGNRSLSLAQQRDSYGKSALDYAAVMDSDALYNMLQDSLPSAPFDPTPAATVAAAAAAMNLVPATKPRAASLAVSELSDPACSPYQMMLRDRADSILSEIQAGARSSVGRASLSTETHALPAVVQSATAAAALAAGAKVVRANIVDAATVSARGDKKHKYVEYRVVVEAQRSSLDTTLYQWEIRPRFSEFKALQISLAK